MYNGCVQRGTMQTKGFPKKAFYLSYMRSAIRNTDMILPKYEPDYRYKELIIMENFQRWKKEIDII